jgi:hypothetical protein
MELILGEMEKALGAGLSNPKNAALIGAYIHVIRERQDTVIHRDILLNIAATWIIRDDENPDIVNSDIHNFKLELFEQLSKGGAKDFLRHHLTRLRIRSRRHSAEARQGKPLTTKRRPSTTWASRARA